MNYVSYVTGNEYYENYCKPFLNSIYQNDKKDNKVYLYFSDVSSHHIENTIKKFDKFVIFINMPRLFGDSFWSKMTVQSYCFAHFLENFARKNDISCLIDCDTLVLKNVASDVKDTEFDVSLTVYKKPHKTPYGDVSSFPNGKNRFNAGVIFAKGNAPMSFFYELAGRLIFYVATNRQHVYPHSELLGPQQSAIGLMLFGNELAIDFDKPLLHNGLKFNFLPCNIYNETESIGDIGDEVKIIHLKGGWRKLIPDPDWESVKNTPRRKEWSKSIYEQWEKYKW